MPGLAYSIDSSQCTGFARRFECAISWLRHVEGYVTERFSEPGFELACVYAPQVCSGPRLLVTPDYVLAVYGNVHDDSLHDARGRELCERLLARYLDAGVTALQHLNGRYDVVVWQRRERVLHQVSDRFGANRHYYLHGPDSLHVACEVKALAAWLGTPEIDPAGLASMLSFGYQLGDLSMLENVRSLPNARVLSYRDSTRELELTRYWAYPYGDIEPLDASEDELAEEHHRCLTLALKRQLRGVKKILLPISGGLDSRTLAGLLKQSGFAGDVLAFSYGQPSSRDFRYGRAIARALGYRHIGLPPPRDFLATYQEQSAWELDGEWTSELAWARASHRHPALGDLAGYSVLSGLYGDPIHGDDTFHYRRRTGDAPLALPALRAAFIACAIDYLAPAELAPLFADIQTANRAAASLHAAIDRTLAPLTGLTPYLALLRTEFEHRQRRHTATVAQSIERDLPALTPFLDTGLVDFTLRIPYALFHNKRLYKHMIRTRLSKVAAIPYSVTGLPLAHAPIRAALKWRLDAVGARFPALGQWLARRNAFFDFHQGVRDLAAEFEANAGLIEQLSPPLDADAARAHFRELLRGHRADQACAFLPPALFMAELRRRLAAEPGLS